MLSKIKEFLIENWIAILVILFFGFYGVILYNSSNGVNSEYDPVDTWSTESWQSPGN